MLKVIATTIATLVALSLSPLPGGAGIHASGANENLMPGKVHSDAATKREATRLQPQTAMPAPSPSAPQPPQPQEQSPLKIPLVNPKIVVSKSTRQLSLYSDGRLVRAYRIALGANPVDDKLKQGDRATPEGDFYVCVKNARSNFYLSLGLSYPNVEDAERGLRDKLITRAERDAIVSAIKNRRCPPWDTALGGEIFIHGGGTEDDWTWGCAALDNPDIKELFDAVPIGTSVRIER
ncbi:MAG TPA: L,D-transpeptidase [Pyrinomonadaceae bacterium]|jgi:lipoprotein-anchoring transpeptidase ErfK/SrfK|nr:L,D-transpeptidase [Pyrinomonadaceae bacterium]